MSYTFQDLPYAYDALEPVIDEATMHLHKDKHHKTYFDKFVAAIAETDLFLNGMRAPQENNAPSGELANAINAAFGSFEDFQKAFADAAVNQFGSGWAWLSVQDGKLVVSSTPNQDNPLMDVAAVRGTPILGLDVWEHAYYLNYQNKRPDYVSNWWKVVNWDYVSEQYAAVK